MTPFQFWHEDEGLFTVYQKAYLSRCATTAYYSGARVYEAISKAINNALASNRSERAEYSNEPPDVIAAMNEKTKAYKAESLSIRWQKAVDAWI